MILQLGLAKLVDGNYVDGNRGHWYRSQAITMQFGPSRNTGHMSSDSTITSAGWFPPEKSAPMRNMDCLVCTFILHLDRMVRRHATQTSFGSLC